MLTALLSGPEILCRMVGRYVGRLLLMSSCAVCVPALAQTGPSGLPSAVPASAAAYGSGGQQPRPTHRAEVSYASGLLTIVASNSSLNQILREVARLTGMKLTGGVAEDRVFGTYGPAPPSLVLANLLDGTGSNLLIVQDASSTPTELILTPRMGGVTPPNPTARNSDENDSSDEDAPQVIRSSPPSPPPASTTQPQSSRSAYRTGTGGVDTNPAATSPSSTSQQLVFPPADATTPPATATVTPTAPDPSSDSVKTPQQIFEQLQRLRQQQTQQPKPQ